MAGRILTAENKKLLEMIYDFGGYVRIAHLDCISNTAISNKWRLLEKLRDMGYLTARRFRTTSKMEPVTYQVTKPTCRMFNNPDSYFRKKHKVEYAQRALIKSYFCFENYSQLNSCFITDNIEKHFLFKNADYNESHFPRKSNKGKSFIHFEELIINFTQNSRSSFTRIGDVTFKDDGQTVVVVHIDKYHVPVKKQILFITNRYMGLIQSSGKFNINFLIVVDSIDRERLYKKEINAFLDDNVKIEPISNELLKIYWEVLYKTADAREKDKLESDLQAGLRNLRGRVFDNMENGMYNNLTREDEKMISQVKLKGENYVKEVLREHFVKKSTSEFIKFYKAFFNKLFTFEHKNHFSFSKDPVKKLFDIKVYKIGYTIYD